MLAKRSKSKGKSKKGQKHREKKAEFPLLAIRDILNPFGDTILARHERQKVFRRLVRNQPVVSRIERDLDAAAGGGTSIPRPVPAVADTDKYLVEIYGQIYHADSKAKSHVGDENDRGKVMPARDGGRLNTFSVKELQKIIVSLNKNRKKIVVFCGLAATEKTQIANQLATFQQHLAAKKQSGEMSERTKQDLEWSIRHSNKVYKEKLKATQSEYHQTLFNGKTAHITYYLQKWKQHWKEEKNQHEQFVIAAERAQYDKLLLERMGREINQDELRRQQVSKKDYLTVLQKQLEIFELFINDTQAEVDGKIKSHAYYLDKLKQQNFRGMIVSQDKTISEMRKFFHGINTANSNIIHQLKANVNRKRLRLDRLERDVFIALEENAKLIIPLNEMNIEVARYEAMVAGAEKVRAEHQHLWIKAKKLEEHVLRLKWKRELAVDRENKVKLHFDKLQQVYTNTMMQTARKAAVAELIHNRTCSLLEEELTIYNMSFLIMQAFIGTDFKGTLYRDSRIQQFLEKQEQEIFQLKVQGSLLKRKYDRNRHALLDLYQRKFLRLLQSTGFHIPTLETYLVKELAFFNGITDTYLLDIEKQPDLVAALT